MNFGGADLLWRAHLAAFPPSCRRCRALLPPRNARDSRGAYPYLCSACHRGLPWLVSPDAAPAEVAIDGIHRLWGACAYADPVSLWIRRLKYAGEDALLRLLGALLETAIPPAELETVDLAVPVPLHPWRLWQRGFNQSLLLAHVWARGLKNAGAEPPQVAADVLVRNRYTRPQVRMTADERRANLVNAFSLHRRLRKLPQPLEGQHVLLVDDVATTGSTLAVCAAALREAGAETVDALVVALAVR